MVLMSSLVAQMVNNLPAVQETQFRSLGQEDPLEKGLDAFISFNPPTQPDTTVI